MNYFDDPKLWGNWALSLPAARELEEYLWTEKPRALLETGSGSSTLIFARYALENDATAFSWEHDARYFRNTSDLLGKYNLEEGISLEHRPLVKVPVLKEMLPWYGGVKVKTKLDFVLVDGPPRSTGGRLAAMFQLWNNLADDFVLWLDDANRPGEQEALNLWEKEFPVQYTIHEVGGRATGVVTRK